jgi:Protein of unknown function (DUF1566)
MGQEQTHKSPALKIGDVMPVGDPHAGWIYAGISKTTKAPFYAAANNAGEYRRTKAMAFAISTMNVASWVYFALFEPMNEPCYLDVAMKNSSVFKWNEAMEFARKKDARLPSKMELTQIYEAKDEGALKNTFNLSGSRHDGWYLSATEIRDDARYAWGQRFDNGHRDWHIKDGQSALRLVRD